MEEEDGGGPDGPPGPHVLVMSPDAFSSVRLPTSGTVNVGRSSKCVIRIEDPLASREHARLHVSPGDGGLSLRIEDLGSANGTRVRNLVISPGQLAPFVPGDAIAIGSTVLMVQYHRPAVGTRRLWSHAIFESRLTDACDRALAAGASFAMARVRLTGTAPWTRVLPILVRTIPPPHLFAAYGPLDYEIPFLETQPNEVMRQVELLASERPGRRTGVRPWRGLVPTGRPLHGCPAGARERAAPAGRGQSGGDGPAGGNGTTPRPGQARRHLEHQRARPGRDRGRERRPGAGDPPAFVAQRSAGRPQLRRSAGDADRNRAVRARKGGFHRRRAHEGRAARGGERGDGFSGRDRRDAVVAAAQLLRAIEAREVLPVGAVKPRPIDVRFIAATNRDLEAEVSRGTSPQRFLLPPQRHHPRHSAAARTHRRNRGARGDLRCGRMP